MTTYQRHARRQQIDRGFIESIPAHWEAIRLRFVATPRNSNVDKKSYDGQTQVVLCNYTDVYYNERLTADLGYMPATASDSEIEAFSLCRGDVVLTKDSETADDIGIPALVAEELPGVVCGYHLCVLRPHRVLGEYLLRVIQSSATKAFFFVEVAGVTRFGLGQDTIRDLLVPVPPSSEQRAICDWIDRETARIDALIEKKTRFIELLREKRQELIAQAVKHGLDSGVPTKDSGAEWLGCVPAHWRLLKLRHIARIVRGASPRPAGDPQYFVSDNSDGTNTPWVTVAEITKDTKTELTSTDGFLTPLGVAASQSFSKGTVIFSNSGATLGVPKILAIDCCANDGVLAFKNLSPEATALFIYYYLATLTERLREEMQKGAQPNLNTDIVKAIDLPLPSVAEQMEIVDHITAETLRIDALTNETFKSIDLLRERRAALITAAVTGQIDVRADHATPALEPA